MKWREFLLLLQSKRLICFGASLGLKHFAMMIRGKVSLEDTVDFIVDNSPEKQGVCTSLNGKEFLVCSLEEIRKKIQPYHAVLVTCKNGFQEIVTQLSAYPETAGLPVYHYINIRSDYSLSSARNVALPNSLRRTAKPIIPKIIHYCWFGGKPLPEKYKGWMASWKKFCPGYEILEWNESNYDVMKHPYMRAAYQAGNYGFVSDYARLDIIYNYGGIYLDTDVELVRSLDDLLYAEGFMGMQTNGLVATGLGFGARKGHPTIRVLRDDYNGRKFVDCVDNEVRWRYGVQLCPDIQTEVLLRYGFIPDGFRYQAVAGLVIYPVPVLCGLVEGEVIMTEKTYSIHYFEGAWASNQ